jgi:hypothetical protein
MSATRQIRKAGLWGWRQTSENGTRATGRGRPLVCNFERERFESLLEEKSRMVCPVIRNIVRATHDILGRRNARYPERHKYMTRHHGVY